MKMRPRLVLFVLTLALIWSLDRGSVHGFIPDIKFIRPIWKFINGVSNTHQTMTRAAVLGVAADLLGVNPKLATDVQSLITAYYGKRQKDKEEIFDGAIEQIESANSEVDLGKAERIIAAAHFDCEQFLAGQNRLIGLRKNVVAQIRKRNFALAWEETGRMLHTLQDFYSHSNWIENGNKSPYQVLGEYNKKPSNLVDRNTATCTDCEDVGFFLPFKCYGNIVSHVRDRKMLTSGYYGGQINDQGEIIEKPPGKCSHGGILDSSRKEPATGGINKDSRENELSPHHFVHKEAARVAQQASLGMMRKLRRDVKNDKLFGMYLGVYEVGRARQKKYRSKRRTESENILQQHTVGQFRNVRTGENTSEFASLTSFFAEHHHIIFRRSGDLVGTIEHSFPVDSSVFQVLISTSGAEISASPFTHASGADARGLPQYSTSLVSSGMHMSLINVTDSLRGEWRLKITSQGTYSVLVLGSSDVSFSEELFIPDPTSTYGITAISGRPFQGQELAALIEIQEEGAITPTVSGMNLLNKENGVKLLSLSNYTRTSNSTYSVLFLPPSAGSFLLQLVGMDSNGFNFSYISDTAINVASIDLVLHDSRDELIKMRPDESKTITLTLLNKGQSSNFTLTQSTETSYTIEVLESSLANTGPVFLEEDSSAEIEIHIKTFSNATGGGGTRVTLTVFVESSINSDISDFITLPVMITEPSAPASTEFIINLASKVRSFKMVELMVIMILAMLL